MNKISYICLHFYMNNYYLSFIKNTTYMNLHLNLNIDLNYPSYEIEILEKHSDMVVI